MKRSILFLLAVMLIQGAARTAAAEKDRFDIG